nr:hypothetical protein [Microbacterium bovistercoris]
MTSLREELLGAPDAPTMRMLVPGGWEVIPLEGEGYERFAQRFRTTVKRAGRPDVDAYVTSMLKRWIGDLRERGGLYAILPLDLPDQRTLPMSLTVSLVGDDAEHSLEDWVTAKIRQGTTEFLDDGRTVLAWQTRTAGRDEMAGTVSCQYSYLIPVPGTSRRKAVMLAGTHLVEATDPEDAPHREAANALFDAMALALDFVPTPAANRA